MGEGRSYAKPTPSKKRQIVRVLAALLAVAGVMGALIWLLIKPAHTPEFFAFFVTEYSGHIPVNAQARQDWHALSFGNYFPDKTKNLTTSQEKGQLEEDLDYLKQRPASQPVVVYLNAHLVCDHKGELWLLTGKSDIDKPTTWLPFRKVLQAIHDCPARQRLLILDTMRPLANLRLGILADDIAARVKSAVEQLNDERLLVLCACAPGQVSLTSESWHRSVFGYYLERGLYGQADGCIDGRRDLRVTVKELYHFVQARVDRWAQQNRNTRQTPLLIGPEDEARTFELVVVDKNRDLYREEESAPAPETYPLWLRGGWQLRDQWWQDQTFRIAPRLFRQLEETLLQAEQQWRGGTDLERVEQIYGPKIKAYEGQVRELRKRLPRPGQLVSLAQIQAYGTEVDPPLRGAAKELGDGLNEIERILRTPPGNEAKNEPAKDPKEELVTTFLAKFQDKMTKAYNDATGFDVAWVTLEALQDAQLDPDRIHIVDRLLGKRFEKPRFVETLFLRRLQQLVVQMEADKTAWLTKAEAIRRALGVLRDGERAVACASRRYESLAEPRALSWIQPLLDTAAQRRHDAEVLLFAHGFASVGDARQLFDEASGEFQNIDGYLETLQEGYRIYDEVLTLLPGYVPYLINHANRSFPDRERWQDMIRTLPELAEALSRPHGQSKSASEPAELGRQVSEIKAKTELVRSNLESLRSDLAKRIEQAAKEPTPQSYLDATALLEIPWLRVEQREKLWTASQQLARQLYEQRTKPLDQRDAPLPAPGDWQQETKTAQRTEQECAALRFQIMVDLLKLGDWPEADKLEADLARAKMNRENPAIWPELGHLLRRTWANLPTQLASVADAVARDRRGRIIHPLDQAALLDNLSTNPTVELCTAHLKAHWSWLYARYLYEKLDLQGLADGNRDEAAMFYANAAEEYSTGGSARLSSIKFRADSTSPVPTLRRDDPRTERQLRLFLEKGSEASPTEKNVRTLIADRDWIEVTPTETALDGDGPFSLPLTLRLKPEADVTNTPPPRGFLIQARVNGRAFHHKFAVSLPSLAKKRLQLLVGNQKALPATSLTEIGLRPNVKDAAFYVFVRNPDDQKKIAIVKLKTDPGAEEELQSAPIELEAGKWKVVGFERKPAVAAASGEKSPPLAALKSKALHLSLFEQNADKKLELVEKKQVRVTLRMPKDYVEVQLPQFEPGEKTNQLTVTVKVTNVEALAGKACPVELILSPDRIPGLLQPVNGNLTEELAPGKERVDLFAKNLRLEHFDQNGIVGVKVDGCEGIYLFDVTFASGGAKPAARQVFGRALHLPTPLLTQPNQNYRVPLKVDNPRADVILEVGLDRTNKGNFPLSSLKTFEGDLDERIGFDPSGPEGALRFETFVEERNIPVDTSGMKGGKCALRVRTLLKGRPVGEDAQETIVVDDSRPAGLHFLKVNEAIPGKGAGKDTPLIVAKAASLRLSAEGQDPESGIQEVIFFVGEPENDQRPKEVKFATRASPLNDERTQWGALLAVPPGEALKLTAEFINKVGLHEFETISLELRDPATIKAAARGSIRGKVIEGVNDRPIADVTVTLTSGDGDKKTTKTTTNDKGEFVFADLKLGSYTISCYNPLSRRKGSEPVTVEEGSATRPIQLRLR
jgi:hypothetical protein